MGNEELKEQLKVIEKVLKKGFESLNQRMTTLEEGFESNQERFDVLEEHVVMLVDGMRDLKKER